MKAKLVGIKHISGNSKKDGKAFAFDTACMTTDMPTRDVEKGAIGLDVVTPVVPERYADILCASNIGKDFEVEFYFANGRTNIGYCAVSGK